MGREYFIFYAEANIVCVIILAILLINDKLHSTKQEKQIWFNRTIAAHILYFTVDIGWAAVLSGNLPRTRFLVVLFNLCNYILLSLITYEWFMYMAASEKMAFRFSQKQRILCMLPMILSIAGIVIGYICAPTFWVGENGELNFWYYPLMVAAPAFYLQTSFVFSMINAGKTKNGEEKKLYRMIGIYPLGILGFGLIQTFSLNAPLFCFGCAILMLVFYIRTMQSLISVDSLTRINNRGQIDRYMEQVRYRENVCTYAMMIDIDRFKEINDTYGHAEGDKALVLVSETLKQIAESVELPVFIGRYGGDEFTIFVQCPEGSDAPAAIAEKLKNTLHDRQTENRLPYRLEVSIGCELLRDQNDTLKACLERADEKLYENKRSKR